MFTLLWFVSINHINCVDDLKLSELVYLKKMMFYIFLILVMFLLFLAFKVGCLNTVNAKSLISLRIAVSFWLILFYVILQLFSDFYGTLVGDFTVAVLL